MTYWDDVSRHVDLERFWMSDPAVRRRIGRLVSGDPERGFSLEWFARRMKDELPYERALSIGCGTGALERHVALLGVARRTTAIDTSAGALEYAREAAAESGVADRVAYETADAHDYLARTRGWDAVFFHGALHHLDRLPELFSLLRAALRPGGVLFLDEYMGPSRAQWGWRRMVLPNLVYAGLPRSVRRTKIVRKPVTDADPTEMLRASEIGPLTRRHFDVVEWRDYGGNLVSLIYPSLRRPSDGAGTGEFARALETLFRAEDFLLRLPGVRSFHSVVIARRR